MPAVLKSSRIWPAQGPNWAENGPIFQFFDTFDGLASPERARITSIPQMQMEDTIWGPTRPLPAQKRPLLGQIRAKAVTKPLQVTLIFQFLQVSIVWQAPKAPVSPLYHRC